MSGDARIVTARDGAEYEVRVRSGLHVSGKERSLYWTLSFALRGGDWTATMKVDQDPRIEELSDDELLKLWANVLDLGR